MQLQQRGENILARGRLIYSAKELVDKHVNGAKVSQLVWLATKKKRRRRLISWGTQGKTNMR